MVCDRQAGRQAGNFYLANWLAALLRHPASLRIGLIKDGRKRHDGGTIQVTDKAACLRYWPAESLTTRLTTCCRALPVSLAAESYI